jgi:putative polyhydroxyalkanoate system protein
MSKIKVTRQHAMGGKKARAAVEKLASSLGEELDADYHWEGSSLQFTRTGASGHIDVGDDDVKIEIKLGMLLTPLKGKIEKTIEEKMDEYLTA